MPTITDGLGKEFPKEGEVEEVVEVDGGVGVGAVESVDTLEECVLGVDELLAEEVEELPVCVSVCVRY